MRWRRLAVAAAAIAVLAILAGLLAWLRKSPTAQRKPAPAAQTAAPPPQEITLVGRIQAAKVVNVAGPLDGTIEQFLAEIGQHVFEGELLARIRNPKLAEAQAAAELELRQAQSYLSELESGLLAARLELSRFEAEAARAGVELERSRKAYERQQLMFQDGVTPRLEYEKAGQDYNARKAESEKLADASRKTSDRVQQITRQLEPARKTVAERTSALEDARAATSAGEVRSPADGVVVARRGQAGDPVAPDVADLFQIAVDPVALEVAAPVEPAMAARIHSGHPAVIRIAGLAGAVPGTVREVKAGQVYLDLSKPAEPMRPGMTAQATISLK